MEAKELLNRARIQIQFKNSFFAYLSLYLKFKESEDLPDYAGAGINAKGDFYYKKEYIKSLNDNVIKSLVVHEILHLSLLHLLRTGNRDPFIFNLSCDVVVNQLLKDNDFQLGEGWIVSDENNCIEICGVKIKDCNKKTAEQIYDELKKYSKEIKSQLGEDGNGMRFDEHILCDDKGRSLSNKELKEIEKQWADRTQQALTMSEMRGDIPQGIERLIGELHKEKINWKALLNRYITQQISFDYSYHKFHKKSISSGVYMPGIIKDRIQISVMIDLSGSIGEGELTDFLSEICGITRAYQDRIEMRVYSHDTECYDNGLIVNGNIEKIKKMELKGGGGTSFSQPLEYLKENNINPKCLIWFSDGYGTDFKKPNFPILWILSKDGSDGLLKNKGQIIKLDGK
jgi:predicted metal-dependent peptidase